MDIAEKLTLSDDKHQWYNLTINYNHDHHNNETFTVHVMFRSNKLSINVPNIILLLNYIFSDLGTVTMVEPTSCLVSLYYCQFLRKIVLMNLYTTPYYKEYRKYI